ncbi:MAG: 2-dehydropantoate 2-reductase [Hyphomicrobiaceae bacterium]|jgi:2-dehydropantoate 2-reductase
MSTETSLGNSPKIAIIGGGALGGYVGGYLTRDGHDVTLVDMWPAHVEHMREKGLTLTGMTEPENFTVKPKAMHLTELQSVSKTAPFDFAFVSVKSYDTDWATQMVKQYLSPAGFVVSLQNGINEDRIANVMGWGRTVGCIASKIAVELTEPGQIRRNVALGGKEHTIFRIGETHGRSTERVERISSMLSAIDSSKVTDNLWGERWSKLCINCMRNPVSAATGRGGNGNDQDPVTRKLAIMLAGEAVKIGLAQGYVLENMYGLTPEQLLAAHDGDSAALKQCEDKLIEGTKTRSGEQRPSMGQDMQKGRRTEIDYLNGLVAARGDEIGIPAPYNHGIAEVVRKIERGEVDPAPEAVAHLMKA